MTPEEQSLDAQVPTRKWCALRVVQDIEEEARSPTETRSENSEYTDARNLTCPGHKPLGSMSEAEHLTVWSQRKSKYRIVVCLKNSDQY